MTEQKKALEVLVTTMHQQDTQKYDEMHLQTNAVIANQTDANDYREEEKNGHTVKMISTNTRGLSRNRNIALSLSTGDLIMFADDDLVFRDGYEHLVLDEFRKHPEAESIAFAMEVIAIADAKKAINSKVSNHFRHAGRRELARLGVCGLVIRKDILQKYCLHFNETFGAGTEDYCGEDTIFLQTMLKKKIKIFLSPVIVADIDKSESTWFDGFNRKRFYVNGKILAATYPYLARLLAVRSAYKFSKRQKEVKYTDILKCYWQGIHDYLSA